MLESKNKLGWEDNIWGVWCEAIPSGTAAWSLHRHRTTAGSVRVSHLGSGVSHFIPRWNHTYPPCITELQVQPLLAKNLLLRVSMVVPPFPDRRSVSAQSNFHCFVCARGVISLTSFRFYFFWKVLIPCSVTLSCVHPIIIHVSL